MNYGQLFLCIEIILNVVFHVQNSPIRYLQLTWLLSRAIYQQYNNKTNKVELLKITTKCPSSFYLKLTNILKIGVLIIFFAREKHALYVCLKYPTF